MRPSKVLVWLRDNLVAVCPLDSVLFEINSIRTITVLHSLFKLSSALDPIQSFIRLSRVYDSATFSSVICHL